MRFIPFFVVFGAAVAACSGSNKSSGSMQASDCSNVPATGTIPSDVNAVLQDRCQACHSDPPQDGAPFALVTYADVHSQIAGTPIYAVMQALIQPGGDPHMPYGDAPQLSTDQFDTLNGWLLDCAPPGN